MDTLPGYQNFLESKRLVAEKKLSFYLHWVSTFISYCHKEDCSHADDSRILSFLNLLAKSKEDWQVNQAREALRLYHFYLAQATQGESPPGADKDTDAAWRAVAQQMKEALRLRHRAVSTEKTYMKWLRSFYSSPRFTDSWPDLSMGAGFGCRSASACVSRIWILNRAVCLFAPDLQPFPSGSVSVSTSQSYFSA